MELPVRYVPNWTSIAGAIEGVLEYLGAALPTHAVMGLTGLAFALRLEERGGSWFPSPPSDPLPTRRVVAVSRRLGLHLRPYEGPATREDVIEWIQGELGRGRPVLAKDLRGPGWGIVRGIDVRERHLLISDLLEPEVGPRLPWEELPASPAELLIPSALAEAGAAGVVREALTDAAQLLTGEAPFLGEVHGAPALEAWAELLRSGRPLDRPGHALHIARLHAARLAAAQFCEDLAAAFEAAAEALRQAARSLRQEASELSQLLTLFPYPSGGGSTLSHPGMRRIAASNLERAAELERAAGEALGAARRHLD